VACCSVLRLSAGPLTHRWGADRGTCRLAVGSLSRWVVGAVQDAVAGALLNNPKPRTRATERLLQLYHIVQRDVADGDVPFTGGRVQRWWVQGREGAAMVGTREGLRRAVPPLTWGSFGTEGRRNDTAQPVREKEQFVPLTLWRDHCNTHSFSKELALCSLACATLSGAAICGCGTAASRRHDQPPQLRARLSDNCTVAADHSIADPLRYSRYHSPRANQSRASADGAPGCIGRRHPPRPHEAARRRCPTAND
jgi:hypothetical protein